MGDDTFFIKKTFNLAKKGEGFTSPNPMVGAIVVKDNKIIATGFHKKAGLPHAEAEALQKAKTSLRDATLYVNLEPCFHWGRTPPCVDRIIDSGIGRVVVATTDPNPRVKGKSIKKLKKAGLEVRVGIMETEAKKLNEVFFKNMQDGLPFVAIKVAQSLDGKIATKFKQSKWITHQKARFFSHRLRDRYDAVLVGVNTVIQDNPYLGGTKKEPFRVVIDPQLRIPLNSFLVKRIPKKLIVFCSQKGARKRKKIDYLRRKASVYILKEKGGFLDLKEVLSILYRREIMSVFVEGGSTTWGRFFDQKLVDKIYFFFAPKIIGGSLALSSIGGRGVSKIKEATEVRGLEIKIIGEDFLITGYPYFN
jgi:diaminohydroxyphosphoribosylaminopyrimidine deaminase/5-amino-6-(5-phosphoribosylamino)uracil reductase